MKKKKTKAQLKKELWKVFSLYIKKRDNNICFTCGRYAEGSGYHSGHFIPKSVGGLALYFNEENVHGQCYNCNINLGGNQYIYGEKLGKKLVNKLRKIQHNTITKDFDYEGKIGYYKQEVEKLLNED